MRIKKIGVYLRHRTFKNLVLAFFVAFALIAVGTVVYMHLIGLSLLDALYFTVTTLGTVGFGDIKPGSPEAKLFTVGFVLVGVSLFLYMFSVINNLIFEGTLAEVFRMEDTKERLMKMQSHTVLCGYGDVGEILAEKIKPIVVVDKDDDKMMELMSKDILTIAGDSTRPEILSQAGVERAKSIVIALNSDPDVLFTILTARELNPKIKVYARANRKESVGKMKSVGADYVVCLPEIGGLELLKAIEGGKA